MLENTAMPAIIDRRGPGRLNKSILQRASHILDKMGLAQRLHHKPNALSGGEAQRVAIARALVNMPDLILCDEPTGNLDSSMGSQIYGIIYDISKQHDITTIVVTHHDHEKYHFDKILHMKDGAISS